MRRARRPKPSEPDQEKHQTTGLSRREFATRATAVAAGIVADPRALLGAARGAALAPTDQQPADQKPKLSPAAQAEVDEKVAAVLRRYGNKLNDQQKTDVRRLLDDAQTQIEALRAYPLENSDEPATILHLEMTAAHRTPAATAAAPAGARGTAKKPGGGV